jgi:hypothetical protein
VLEKPLSPAWTNCYGADDFLTTRFETSPKQRVGADSSEQAEEHLPNRTAVHIQRRARSEDGENDVPSPVVVQGTT